jgi:hypothetical protein
MTPNCVQEVIDNEFELNENLAHLIRTETTNDTHDLCCYIVNFAIRLNKLDPKTEAIETLLDDVFGCGWEKNQSDVLSIIQNA